MDLLSTFLCLAVSWVRNIWVFSPLVPSKREKNVLVFAQFVYFLREVFLLFNSIIQKLKSKQTPQQMYKLRKTNIFFSRFEGTRGEKTQIFRT